MKPLEKEIREIEFENLKEKIEETKGILIEGNLDPETYAIMVGLMNKDIERLEEMAKEIV